MSALCHENCIQTSTSTIFRTLQGKAGIRLDISHAIEKSLLYFEIIWKSKEADFLPVD